MWSAHGHHCCHRHRVSARRAIGIVRLSGAETRRVLAALFTPVDGRSAAELPPRRMTYGTVRDAEGRTLDHALAVVLLRRTQLHGRGERGAALPRLAGRFAGGACAPRLPQARGRRGRGNLPSARF